MPNTQGCRHRVEGGKEGERGREKKGERGRGKGRERGGKRMIAQVWVKEGRIRN